MQRGRRHVGVDADRHGHARIVAARELLEEDRGKGPVEPRAAPLGVVAQPEHVQVAHHPEQALVHAAHLIELARPGSQLFLGELARGLAKELVLGSVEEIGRHRRVLGPAAAGVATPASGPAAALGTLC